MLSGVEIFKFFVSDHLKDASDYHSSLTIFISIQCAIRLCVLFFN